jgi:hypothetical protein
LGLSSLENAFHTLLEMLFMSLKLRCTAHI